MGLHVNWWPGMSNVREELREREKGRGRETEKDRKAMSFVAQSWKWQTSLLL